MENAQKKTGLQFSTKSFIVAISILFALMVIAYVLTLVVPSGAYTWIIDADGNRIIDTTKDFQYTSGGGISFLRWIFSPFLILGGSEKVTLIAIIAFLIIIGGVFNCLDKCGFMNYMLTKITHRFGKSRYKLLALVVLFFMAMGSLIGSFEEVAAIVPIAVALCVSLGFDALTGIAISILATGCGFAAGVFNPFTVGVAETLIGETIISGFWLRLVSFAIIYGILVSFIILHAKKVERKIEFTQIEFTQNKDMNKAILAFVIIMGIGVICVFLSAVVEFLQGITMVLVALMFLIGGTVSTFMCKISVKEYFKNFGSGALGILPAVLMILMASSIKFTLDEAGIMDTIIHFFAVTLEGVPKWLTILFIYLIVLIFNFFIPSGSAKAFLLIPLIVPLASNIFGISKQLCVLAYIFGDGFSNVIYPTNPVLLLSLGLGNVEYSKWFKWTIKFQAIILAVTSLILMFGYLIGY